MKVNHKILSHIGNIKLTETKPIALFCSVKCPGSLILKTHDLAIKLRRENKAVISGFHSPIEKECLRLLLKGEAPIIICPARSIKNMRIPKEWKKPIDEGKMLILSSFSPKIKRATVAASVKRNYLVASLADKIFVSYAEPGSKTETLCKEWISRGKPVLTFDSDYNKNLLKLGSEPIEYFRDTVLNC